jgi:hypothetical protein
MRNASNSTPSTNNATFTVFMHCGQITLTVKDGLVISETNNFKEEVVSISTMNIYIKRGWLQELGWELGWRRIVSAAMSLPNAGEGREEEFMMHG